MVFPASSDLGLSPGGVWWICNEGSFSQYTVPKTQINLLGHFTPPVTMIKKLHYAGVCAQ